MRIFIKSHSQLSNKNNPSTLFVASITKPTRRKQVESIQLKVNVKIGAVEIEFANDRRRLSLIQLEGAGAGLVLKTSYTQVDCAIANIKVQDLNPSTIHKDVSIDTLTIFNLGTT